MSNNTDVKKCDCQDCPSHKICKDIDLESDPFYTRRVDYGSRGNLLKKPYRLYYCMICAREHVV